MMSRSARCLNANKRSPHLWHSRRREEIPEKRILHQPRVCGVRLIGILANSGAIAFLVFKPNQASDLSSIGPGSW